ncbi:hypothetical protein ACP70R_009362 [Stipagrostis hirtigluma subsp. patula]
MFLSGRELILWDPMTRKLEIIDTPMTMGSTLPPPCQRCCGLLHRVRRVEQHGLAPC